MSLQSLSLFICIPDQKEYSAFTISSSLNERDMSLIYNSRGEGRAPWDWRHLSLGFALHFIVGLKRGVTSLEFEVPLLPLDGHNSKSHVPPLLHEPSLERRQPLGSCAQGKEANPPFLESSPNKLDGGNKCPLTLL